MAWNQTRDCRDAADGGEMSATDGDLDTALRSIWRTENGGGYHQAFDRAQTAILERDVTEDGMMRLGDWAVEGGVCPRIPFVRLHASKFRRLC